MKTFFIFLLISQFFIIGGNIVYRAIDNLKIEFPTPN
jgi:hypothetical protein